MSCAASGFGARLAVARRLGVCLNGVGERRRSCHASCGVSLWFRVGVGCHWSFACGVSEGRTSCLEMCHNLHAGGLCASCMAIWSCVGGWGRCFLAQVTVRGATGRRARFSPKKAALLTATRFLYTRAINGCVWVGKECHRAFRSNLNMVRAVRHCVARIGDMRTAY